MAISYGVFTGSSLAPGGQVAFDFNGKSVTVMRAQAAEHIDPAIARLLSLIKRDIAQGKNLSGLPPAPATRQDRAAISIFFRYDSRTKVIVYAWGNDESKPRRIHEARRGQQA